MPEESKILSPAVFRAALFHLFDGGGERKRHFQRIEDHDAALRARVAELEAENVNHAETLRSIKAMDPATEGDRMRQWASDGLAGYTETNAQTMGQLMDERDSLRRERDEARKLANCGGNPFTIDGVHQVCQSDPMDPHLIYGCAHGDKESGFACELHSFRETLDRLTSELAAAIQAGKADKARLNFLQTLLTHPVYHFTMTGAFSESTVLQVESLREAIDHAMHAAQVESDPDDATGCADDAIEAEVVEAVSSYLAGKAEPSGNPGELAEGKTE